MAFTIWTMLIQTIDVKSTGINGTDIVFQQSIIGFVGLIQLIKRRSLFKVDKQEKSMLWLWYFCCL